MRLALGALIAVILLGLYVYSVVVGVLVVDCVTTPACTRYPASAFTAGMVQVLTLVGGLVSALVIAELAITSPGEQVMARALESAPSPRKQNAVKVVTAVYLLVWLGAGLAAFVVGVMQHPTVLQPLTDFGLAWLGLAVAAAYAYLGLDPQRRPENDSNGRRESRTRDVGEPHGAVASPGQA
ncbi:MAG: hypothetical protein ABW277_01420 [Longimicrobiaceae bacterium]